MYQPASTVVHFEGISHGKDAKKGVKSHQVINQEKFLQKWNKVLETEHLSNGDDIFVARDRTANKKTILIIDDFVPFFDKDAGSRTMYQYLVLFNKIGLNVKFYVDNASPFQPHTDALLQSGIEVLYGPWYAENFEQWLKKNGRYIDYTYIQKPNNGDKYMDLIKKYTDSKLICNADDFQLDQVGKTVQH